MIRSHEEFTTCYKNRKISDLIPNNRLNEFLGLKISEYTVSVEFKKKNKQTKKEVETNS
jgi:hypothetical protein